MRTRTAAVTNQRGECASRGQHRDLIQSDHGGHDRERRHDRQHRRRDRGATEPPQRLQHHGDHDRLHAVQQSGRPGHAAEPHVRPREHGDDERRRQDETRTGDDETGPPRSCVPHVDRHLRRVRTRNQIRGTEQVQELGAREPPAPTDDLVLHHRDVRRRAAESGGAELQEQQRELAEGSVCGAWIMRGARPGRGVLVVSHGLVGGDRRASRPRTTARRRR